MKSTLLQLLDEAASNVLLHRFLWSRNPSPLRGGVADDAWRLRSGVPATFYSPAPPPLEPSQPPIDRGSTGHHRVADFAFPSQVQSGFAENDRVWIRHWKSHGRPRWAVLGLDGLVQVGCFWFHRLATLLGPHAIDVVMMDEPFNYRRTPRGYQPGQLILGGDLWHQLAVLRQAVLDAWRVVRHLYMQGYQVGVVGLSFGGLLALLLSLVAPELHFAILIVPPADPTALLSRCGQIGRAMRRGLAASRFDPEVFGNAVRPIRPILWRSLVPPHRIHLHAARWDRIVPPRPIKQLADRWKTDFTQHDGSHITLSIAPHIAVLVAANVVAWTDQPPAA